MRIKDIIRIKGYILRLGVKNFGFIKGQDEEDYFFYTADIYPKNILFETGDLVEFTPCKAKKGLTAKKIILLEKK